MVWRGGDLSPRHTIPSLHERVHHHHRHTIATVFPFATLPIPPANADAPRFFERVLRTRIHASIFPSLLFFLTADERTDDRDHCNGRDTCRDIRPQATTFLPSRYVHTVAAMITIIMT